MGFFSSRKAEPTPLTAAEQASSVKVIRSRFYGKSKTNSINRNAVSSSPSLFLQQTSQLPSAQHRRDPPIGHTRLVSTDALTMSLAERLNDLAVANADGLLDDEEYRLLRQNLFERYAGGSDCPNESPVIPVTRGNSIRDAPHRTHSRPPSVDSQRSVTTAISSLFRRATGRSSSSITSHSASVTGSKFSLDKQTSPNAAEHEASSIYSRPSISSNYPYYHSVSRRPSNDSLLSFSQAGSVSGSVNHDARSIMSRKRGLDPNYAASISSRVTTRSTKPPSSFHLRQHFPSSQLLRSHEGDDDDDNQKTAAELRAEIESVESEGRKLLDAFNGLELTTLTKSRQGVGVGVIGRFSVYSEEQRVVMHRDKPPSGLGSSYTMTPDRSQSIPLVAQPISLKRKPSVVTTIAGSFKSSTSGGVTSSSSTFASASASVSTSTSISTSNVYLSSPPGSLYSSRSSPNLNSASSFSVPAVPALPIATPVKKRPSILRPSKRPVLLPPALAAATTTGSSTPPNAPPPNPPITSSSKLSLTSPSKISLTSSSSKSPIVSRALPVLPETLSTSSHNRHPLSPTKPSLSLSPAKRSVPDPGFHILEAELGEVRRRRTEVALRYERRLEFLRAKLKSAEIKEKLSRR